MIAIGVSFIVGAIFGMIITCVIAADKRDDD